MNVEFHETNFFFFLEDGTPVILSKDSKYAKICNSSDRFSYTEGQIVPAELIGKIYETSPIGE